MRSWFILFLTVTTVSATAFTSKEDLATAIDNCLVVDNTGQACCNKANCGVAGNAEMKSWDTSQVTDMSELFYDRSDFNASIGAWDTSQVTDMGGMFAHASSFNQSLTFDTSNVTNMRSMFQGATAFNQPLTSFDTSQVTDMGSMFWGATAFNQPLTFDTSKVEKMQYMFEGAIAFNQYKWGAPACTAGKLRVVPGAGCTVPVKLTCAQLKAEYQSSSRVEKCGC